ncbi:MAG: hypothetical protein RR449_01485 [Christensenella sp.]
MAVYLLQIFRNGVYKLYQYKFMKDVTINVLKSFDYVVAEAERKHSVNKLVALSFVIYGGQIFKIIGSFDDIYPMVVRL